MYGKNPVLRFVTEATNRLFFRFDFETVIARKRTYCSASVKVFTACFSRRTNAPKDQNPPIPSMVGRHGWAFFGDR